MTFWRKVMQLKRRTRTVILCEQCGNEFFKGRIVEKDGKKFVVCPYCSYSNNKVYKKRKKRGVDTNGKYRDNNK